MDNLFYNYDFDSTRSNFFFIQFRLKLRYFDTAKEFGKLPIDVERLEEIVNR
ncbi:hypothetical protein [Lagierella sp.]|uniref:hypothetical protein n=1 Tax=Lagierella sp. TaxID=2849657 RepID=UPI002602C7B9|nr:hypothetical protein [Lagierella sp.]